MVFLSVLSGASFNTGIDQGLIYSWDFLFRRFQEHILQLRMIKLATQLICLKFAVNVFLYFVCFLGKMYVSVQL